MGNVCGGFGLLVSCVGLLGCIGAIGGDGDSDSSGPGSEPAACEASSPPVVLRYLTRREYENTIRDLLAPPETVTDTFAPDERVDGYGANAIQAPSSTQLAMFVDAAEKLAALTVEERLDRFVDCMPADQGCAESFIVAFGRRAFRRPLAADEIASYLADYQAIADEQGESLGFEVVAASMLASPYFLYLGERGALDDPEAHAFDLASRLSYFLWATMPDDALLQAAESGQLGTHAGVVAQVERMMADERTSAMLGVFAREWLAVDELAESSPKHPDEFPEWNAALADAAERETGALMERVVLEGDGRLASLLESREAFVNAPLAAVYGVAAPSGESGWVTLPETERSGLLTRVAFLARTAHASQNSWVLRGKTVRERLLCNSLPPPPPIADDSPINDDSRLEDEACKGCHTLMDPIGTGFDGYDPIGAFVGGEAPGFVSGLEPGAFEGGIEGSALLAGSPEVQACFAKQMFVFANRRSGTEDTCAIGALGEELALSNGSISELIITLATSPEFIGKGAQ